MILLTERNGLTDSCGHHCGIQRIGADINGQVYVGHCACSECHDTREVS